MDPGIRSNRPASLLHIELQAAAALVFGQALPDGIRPGPDESGSYAHWLAQQPGAGT